MWEVKNDVFVCGETMHKCPPTGGVRLLARCPLVEVRLYGLYGNVPLDRVWFLASLPRTRYTILCEPVLNSVCFFNRFKKSCLKDHF